ncbi:MAG: AI-2E family transporter [Spirochaetaceae bacterium]|nr:MAG: AI-2E family transporter [Spirochaetaceae bacterium]
MDNQRINSALLAVIVVVAVGSVLRLTGSIFLPLVLALLLSFVFSPVVTYLAKHGVPRLLGILSVLAILLTFGFLIGFVVYSSTQSLLREFPLYQRRLTGLTQDLIERFDLPDYLLSEFNINRTLGSLVVSISGSFMAFASGLLLMLVFLLFLLLEKPYLNIKMLQAFQAHTTRKIVIIFAHINAQIGRYLSVKLLVSSLTGGIIFVSFSIIGVDFPIIWAILTFLFNFIPSIGSILITLLSGTFALVQFAPQWNNVIATVLAMSITQMIIGNIIDPKLLGDSLNLSPVVILVSLLLWGWLWGVMGMFLAVPLTVAIKIAFENIPGMEAFGIMMGTGSYRKRKKRQHKHNAGTGAQAEHAATTAATDR